MSINLLNQILRWELAIVSYGNGYCEYSATAKIDAPDGERIIRRSFQERTLEALFERISEATS